MILFNFLSHYMWIPGITALLSSEVGERSHFHASTWALSIKLLFQSVQLCIVWEVFARYLALGAALSVSDVLSDNSLHLLPQHGILSQLWAEETVGRWRINKHTQQHRLTQSDINRQASVTHRIIHLTKPQHTTPLTQQKKGYRNNS